MTLKKIPLKIILSTIAIFLSVPLLILAQNTITPQQWFQNVIQNIINFIVWPVFVGIVVIMFIWAGFLFLTAQGEPGKLDQARKASVWAVVGVMIGLIAFSAANLIKWVLGLT